MAQRHSVTIIGGGVIGLTTSFALWRAGHEVTLVEKQARIASGASRANGGQLSYRYVAPLASPSAPFEALSWLGRSGSPVALHPNADLHQWGWMARFLRSCTEARFRAASSALLTLALESQRELATWRDQGLSGFDWRQPGKLILYRHHASFAKAAKGLSDRQSQRLLTPAECAMIEPAFAALAPELAGGLFTDSEEVADCHAFCLKLRDAMQGHERFRLLHGSAALERSGTRCLVRLNGVPLPSNRVILAAGLASRELARPLGVGLPLYPLRGYSLTVTPPASSLPEVSVTDYDRRVVYARHGARLRIAAMVDIGKSGARGDERRLAQLRRLAQQTLPEAGPYDRAEAWAGERPATPDSVPIIERGPCDNLLFNVGHGALGFTLAPGSARRILSLVGETM
ncbi:FAD-dependent oxidoreductase [Asaia krungthepensis]|uniref:D-amino acid dehydrogenase small subunit n=1 Tax=Asaia krungthepensis NRIC 0535 TaxID=1307925 RepID=A0ABQ0Q3V0_9PROT|nr:FAD-dependent oxidoreductase [Asaia krungthepensis]GBQ90070.1 D-amino acid dehydrogenase small subunit [Asaia krungthepensis NRIC 0535]